MLTQKEIKQRYFDKVLAAANNIPCGCGCGEIIKDRDKFGRPKLYVNGHNGRKYKDPTQYKREWNHRNREARYESKIERGRRLKQKVVELMGARCKKCNLEYDGTNSCVFQVHHKDPSQKEFAVNTRTLINYSWERILREIEKCELLCANCHSSHHNESY